jgi:hypothetical protein
MPHMAQSVLAILFGKPNTARARPSTIYKDDNLYDQVFNSSYDPKVYLNCTLVMKKIDPFIKRDKKDIVFHDKINLRFYLARYVVCLLSGKSEPKGANVAGLEVDKITDEFLMASLNDIHPIYKELWGMTKLQKGMN